MNQNAVALCEFMAYINSLKGKSWADICYEEEEREEAEAKLAQEKKMKIEDEKRKNLFVTGKYDLEDGEIFD
jgi:hypothetical protein